MIMKFPNILNFKKSSKTFDALSSPGKNIFDAQSGKSDHVKTSDFLNPDYRNIVQFKHACLGDASRGSDKSTLYNCTCGYFKKFKLPCMHMYRLALENGIFDELFAEGRFLDTAIDSLSKGATCTLAFKLYYGFYEDSHPFSSLKNKRFNNALLKSGLIVLDSQNPNCFRYSKDVQENIYYVMYRFMTRSNMGYPDSCSE